MNKKKKEEMFKVFSILISAYLEKNFYEELVDSTKSKKKKRKKK